MPATVWVQVEVPDSPHIIERFAELVSRSQPAQDNKPPVLSYSDDGPQPE